MKIYEQRTHYLKLKMHKIVTKEIDLAGRRLKLETGKLAQQADSAVVATWGDTVVLATVATKRAAEEIDYFPLSVEYVEKYYAGGRITGQKFIKREGRPSDKSLLSGRAIDRSIRPLFPKDFRNEVQLIISVLSFDGVNDPAVLGYIASSAALMISSVPWNGPLGVTRIGIKDGETIVNPDMSLYEGLELDLIVAATKERVAMIEAKGKQVKEEVVFESIKKAHQEAQSQIDLINEFAKECSKIKQTFIPLSDQFDAGTLSEIKGAIKDRITKALFDKNVAWHESTGQLIKEDLVLEFKEKVTPLQIIQLFDKVAKEIVNDTVLNKGKRVDGRGMEEVRPIYSEIEVLPRTHGSAIFQRGDTQVLSIATLGPLSASQTLEGMEGESEKRFMHHYNMSINPFSVGEVKRLGSPNRRDVGHGNLVEISMVGVLPSEADFPYAMRVVSEVLAANASSSQGSVCATTLALLDAGVPIEPVAGIALGVLTNGEKFQVITDMRAIEDFYGEMDFKVAGTKNGITGIQMDTKLQGLTFEIVEEALRQGKTAREFILAEMAKVIPTETVLSEYAPKIEITHIDPENIGKLIGSGGKTINGIIAKTGAQIDIEDDGTVMISSTDIEAVNRAMEAVSGMFKEITVGEEYTGKVVKIATFGAFVEIMPGRDGLVHVSQMAPYRVERPEDIVKEGQEVKVRVTEVDSMGKIGLSMLFGNDIKQDSERRPRQTRLSPDRTGGGFGGERKPFGERRPFGGDRGGGRSFDRGASSSRPSGGGFGGERKPFGGERRPFGGDRGGSRGGGSRGGGRGGRGGFDR